jgi:predicted transposase/invertase (TIGR01784 family)
MTKGREESRAEGRAEEKLTNARSLEANGVPLDIIAKSLNLTDKEIAEL